jgi:5-methylcytosine-specific restriction endonuclease McrA
MEFSGRTKVEALKRAGHRCEECGFDGYVEVHHLLAIYYAVNFYPQIAPYLVASLDNAKVLCPDHHRMYDANSKSEHSYYAAKLLGYLDDVE